MFHLVLVFILLGISVSESSDAQFSYPLNSQTIEQYLELNKSTSVDSLIAQFPASLRDHFVLMHHSRSLHRSSYTQPRQIFFGSDARFLLAAGGVPNDPRYSSLEFAEFNEQEGRYYFGVIELKTPGEPRILRNLPQCQICHGKVTRPIWGQYPNWGGAYGSEHGTLIGESKQGFSDFLKLRPEIARYASLQMAAPEDGGSFLLTSRKYPFPNTNFNHELGNTVALGTVKRLQLAPEYSHLKWAVLSTSDALHCIATDAWFDIAKKVSELYEQKAASQFPATTLLFVKAFRLLGIDPRPELSLERPLTELKDGKREATMGRWQTGAYRVDEAIAFHLLVDATREDPKLEEHFAGVSEKMKQIVLRSELTGEERAKALTKTYAWFQFFDVFDPITKDKNKHEEVCSLLSKKL